MKKTNIIEVKVESLIPAEWNYKVTGTAQEIEKLSKSISKDGSSGVFAVREVESDGQTLYEVMDGNHRLEAIQLLNWETVHVENFGKISLAKAVTIARRRNHKWFEDDKLRLGQLMNEYVIPEYGIDDLIDFMPDTESDLLNFQNMANFDWTEPEIKADSATGLDEQKKEIKLMVCEEVFNLWEKWIERASESGYLSSQERAFEFAIVEAMNVPVEKLSR